MTSPFPGARRRTTVRAPRLRALLAALAVALVLPASQGVAPASAADPLTLGFNDFEVARFSGFLNSPVNEPALAAAMENGRRTGAKEWRITLFWRLVARNATAAPQPATLAADPAWSGYVWDDIDRQVRSIAAVGMQTVVWPIEAPAWAEGAGRPAVSKTAPVGSWKPDPVAYGIFGQALARRYSGTYPDPANPGKALPKVAFFQAWNEPNLSTYLSPQWEKAGGKYRAFSPGHFRKLVNAFSGGVKSVQPKAKVLAGGSAPFGDLEVGDPRIQPVAFYRDLLCVTTKGTKSTGKKSCPKLKVDGWAHHTYPIGPPWRTARNADDAVVPDMPKLTRVVKAAAKAGTLSTKAAANVWMTEMSWESAPDPSGLDLTTHAQYMQGAFYLLWKSGVRHIFWFGSRDMAQGSDWNTSFQSGVFARGADPSQDTPKPAFTAFRFPFAAFRDRGVAQLWAKPAGTGPVVVQVETSPGVWKQAAKLKSAGGGVVTGKLRVGPDVNLRAVQGAEVSIPWKTS